MEKTLATTDNKFMLLHDRLASELAIPSEKLLGQLKASYPKSDGVRGFQDFGHDMVSLLSEAAEIKPLSDRINVSRALIAFFASDVVARTEAVGVTPRILERTKDWSKYLLKFLSDMVPEDYSFPNDYFIKDFRFVHALTVPCGAQIVDLKQNIGPKTALKSAQYGVGSALRAYRSCWFRVHTEGRYLDEFNDSGWQECYRELAKLLELHPNIRGMVATSWFYDPQLAEISPRLFYLQELPLQNGAKSIRHKTSDFDIQSATATSRTRRDLYESKKYMPVSYTLLWEREDMILWANNMS